MLKIPILDLSLPTYKIAELTSESWKNLFATSRNKYHPFSHIFIHGSKNQFATRTAVISGNKTIQFSLN